jgi:hypothetical protein
VFWAWLAASFFLWLLAGFGTWKYLASKGKLSGPFVGIALLLLGLGVLCGLFLFLSATQGSGQGLSPVQMAVTSFAGAIFAVSQAAAAAAMLSSVEPSVTNRRRPPSIIENQEGMDS